MISQSLLACALFGRPKNISVRYTICNFHLSENTFDENDRHKKQLVRDTANATSNDLLPAEMVEVGTVCNRSSFM